MDARRSDSFKSAEPVAGGATVPAAPAAPAAKPRRGRARAVLPLVGLLALGGAGAYGWHWWSVGRFLETTDDAYLQSDKVTVAPRIAGIVAAVMVGDNQPVKAGDVIGAPRRPVLPGPAQAGRGRGRQGPGAGAGRRRGDRPAAGAGRLRRGPTSPTPRPRSPSPSRNTPATRTCCRPAPARCSASSRRIPTCASATPPATRPPPLWTPRRSRSTA
ncbi:biotin/lipoyl-binding protein [Methylobacterium oryzae CBMB20]